MEEPDAATVTNIREFAKPNCAKGASGFNLEVQQNIVALRPNRGEMFIESATSKKVFLAPSERNIICHYVPMTETLRSAGAGVIELEAVSINISLPWSENYSVVAL